MDNGLCFSPLLFLGIVDGVVGVPPLLVRYRSGAGIGGFLSQQDVAAVVAGPVLVSPPL